MRRAPLLDHGQVKPISIHAPQWGATGESRPRRRKPSYFNPRTPVGCDVAEQGHVGAVQRISIHAPQWGATLGGGGETQAQPISIHAPQWGATRVHVIEDTIRVISIHAPQWGATLTALGVTSDNAISIHAPQWGATRPAVCLSRRPGNFNPRTPVGCDRHGHHLQAPYRHISIHAPQWGATNAYGRQILSRAIFQSTHPSGVRLFQRALPDVGHDFNPRTPVGCDLTIPVTATALYTFQSTHPSGVRPRRQLTVKFRDIFQSTHPSGVRRAPLLHILRCEFISIHAPQWGATTGVLVVGLDEPFQSTHPSGVRPHGVLAGILDDAFQSTHPSGVRPLRAMPSTTCM